LISGVSFLKGYTFLPCRSHCKLQSGINLPVNQLLLFN
jgi:hypothetical protein